MENLELKEHIKVLHEFIMSREDIPDQVAFSLGSLAGMSLKQNKEISALSDLHSTYKDLVFNLQRQVDLLEKMNGISERYFKELGKL